MATAIPSPLRPSNGPPSSALPALPTGLNKVVDASLHVEKHGGTMMSNIVKDGARTPSNLNKQTPNRVTTLPKYKMAPNTNGASRSLKKQVSITAFPHPPRGNRTISLPSSPLSGGSLTSHSKTCTQLKKAESVEISSPGNIRTKKKKLESQKHSLNYGSGLSNGNSNARSTNSLGRRTSGHLLNLPSPPQSRSSSPQSLNPNFDQNVDYERGREPAPEIVSHSTSRPTEVKGNVLVSVRVRPDIGSNIACKTEGEWMVDGRRALIACRGKEAGDYYFDNVFSYHDNNAKVYDSCAKRLVRRVMEGYHGTVFAYGMTGTGKTFSMQGTASSPGVIPLAITDIFSYIRETPSREFLLRVSYLEIYNEKIHDLLTPPNSNGPGNSQPEEIKLREDSKRGVYASSLKEEIVQSPTQLLRVIARGDQARRTSSTQFNARSSRSHAVVQIVVESRERTPGSAFISGHNRTSNTPGGVRVSTLSLIDLAGSERAAESKERRTEGSHINKSLLTLGTVIAKLSGNKDRDGKPTDKDGKHLPYRDSKLTRLLQGALSGNSLVSILCTIQIGAAGNTASLSTHMSETLNTLKFASRAKNNLVSHAKKAEESYGQAGDGAARVLLERYRMEILDLRSQLEAQAKSKTEDDEREREKEAEIRHDEQMLEMQLARTALKERIEHLNRLILSSKSTGVNVSGSYSSLSMNPRCSIISGNGYNSGMSTRSSITPSIIRRCSLERSSSQGSNHVTARNSGQTYSGGRVSPGSLEDEYSLGEFGDGNASLAAQNRALQADLADKTRYCQTLEKRLIQARRSSHSRASISFSTVGKNNVTGEDQNFLMVLKEKDSEIADLKARLDDKERMLAALRSSVRSRDIADRDPRIVAFPFDYSQNLGTDGTSQNPLNRSSSLSSSSPRELQSLSTSTSDSISSPVKERSKGMDDRSKIIDEMIQVVETGQLAKGIRGGIRMVSERDQNFTIKNV
ncbi:putative kinesin motor domain-containing protein [Erysiphe necator]|uniref:Kinesin-like protein n=1 Tax=Uncinula necator TaxID=52586 RepID=A0A0B1P3J2_UNCNE|nr:putative kinesin motor domain-containing protein [Erysiphe necator]